MGLFGEPIELGAQLLFRDDGSFIFRQLPVLEGFLIEYDQEQRAKRAWMLNYKLLKEFKGYKNIPAGKVTVSHTRDILFDPFNQLNEAEKPDQGEELKKSWVSKIAESVCYRHDRTAKGNLMLDKIAVFEGVVAILLAIAIGFKAAFGG